MSCPPSSHNRRLDLAVVAKDKTKDIRDLLRAELRDGRFRMVDVDPDSTPGLKKRKDARKEMEQAHGKLLGVVVLLLDSLLADRRAPAGRRETV